MTNILPGQVQAPTSTASAVSQVAPVSQISDGQIQATTAAPVSQISDGQIQATTAAPVPATTAPAVSQISDGQIQATGVSSASTSASITPFTGAASRHEYSGLVAAVGALAAFFL